MNWLANFVLPVWGRSVAVLLIITALCIKFYCLGIDHEHAKNEATQNTELVKKQQRILELTVTNRELEHKAAEDTATINNLYQEQKQHAQAQVNHIIHDVRTGHQRLYVNTKPASPDNGGEASAIAAIKLPSDATTRSELSDADAEFLVTFANEADEVVRQLTLCQGKLLIDRNLPVPALQSATEMDQ